MYRCDESLEGADETTRIRRQVVDVAPPPPPKVTEYQLVCCKSQLRGDYNPTTTHDRHHASTRNGRTRPAVTGTHGHQRKVCD